MKSIDNDTSLVEGGVVNDNAKSEYRKSVVTSSKPGGGDLLIVTIVTVIRRESGLNLHD